MMTNTKVLREVLTQCLDTIAFGRVMSRSDKGDPRLSRQMNCALRHFSRQECIRTQRHRQLKVILGGAGAPGDALYAMIDIADQHGLAAQSR